MIANNEARLVNRAVIPTAIIKELTFNNRGGFCDGLIQLASGKMLLNYENYDSKSS